mgnify:CR=1 FL=1
MGVVVGSAEGPGVVKGPRSGDALGNLTDFLDAECAEAEPVEVDEVPVALEDVLAEA